ncbi:MAG TPA: hypothetical protein PLL57_14585 [Flavobacteriales bacterium]|nr:hypothetical protein [Flavobacteriales bacterium]
MRCLALVGLLACSSLCAQNWVNAGMPGYNPTSVIKLYTDAEQDDLLVVGLTRLSQQSPPFVIMRYHNGTWESFGEFQNGYMDAERYGDTLVIGGLFAQVDDVVVQNATAYYDGVWHPYGAFDSSIRNLKLINGELYAIGGFEYVDGQLCNGIAKRVGGGWQCFDPPPQTQTGGGPDFYDAEWYQGELYACGNFSYNSNGENDIIAFDGSGWYAPGGGLTDGLGNGRCLTVYQDELYLGGGFTVADGNAGNCIMKWNGSQWSALNGDLQGVFNDNLTRATALSFLHHDGKLLVGGEFSYVAGNQANRFAVWDGTKWCGYGDTFGPTSFCQSLAVYHDTVFAACGFELNGEPINQVIKWVGDAGFGGEWCNSPIGVEERPIGQDLAMLPVGGGIYQVQLPAGGHAAYVRVLDLAGRVVQDMGLVRTGDATSLVDLSMQAEGLYLLHVDLEAMPRTVRFNHTR